MATASITHQPGGYTGEPVPITGQAQQHTERLPSVPQRPPDVQAGAWQAGAGFGVGFAREAARGGPVLWILVAVLLSVMGSGAVSYGLIHNHTSAEDTQLQMTLGAQNDRLGKLEGRVDTQAQRLTNIERQQDRLLWSVDSIADAVGARKPAPTE